MIFDIFLMYGYYYDKERIKKEIENNSHIAKLRQKIVENRKREKENSNDVEKILKKAKKNIL